jgi:hypothetical protein
MSLVVNIALDALAFVITGINESKDKGEINDAFDDIVASNLCLSDNRTGANEFASGGYMRSTKIPIIHDEQGSDVKYFRLYIAPFNLKHAYVKVALHKHPYQPADYEFVKMTLTKLFQQCRTRFLYAANLRIKKVDIAIDKKTPISNLWFDNKRTQVAMNVYGRSGKIETVYLGDKRSDVRIRIYDKAAQLKSKAHKHNKDHALLRVEYSIKPDCTIDELFAQIDISSKLSKFFVYKAKAIKRAAIFSDEICSLIDFVGIKSVLQSMDQSKRRTALKQMRHFRSKLVSEKALKRRLKALKEDIKLLYDK